MEAPGSASISLDMNRMDQDDTWSGDESDIYDETGPETTNNLGEPSSRRPRNPNGRNRSRIRKSSKAEGKKPAPQNQTNSPTSRTRVHYRPRAVPPISPARSEVEWQSNYVPYNGNGPMNHPYSMIPFHASPGWYGPNPFSRATNSSYAGGASHVPYGASAGMGYPETHAEYPKSNMQYPVPSPATQQSSDPRFDRSHNVASGNSNSMPYTNPLPNMAFTTPYTEYMYPGHTYLPPYMEYMHPGHLRYSYPPPPPPATEHPSATPRAADPPPPPTPPIPKEAAPSREILEMKEKLAFFEAERKAREEEASRKRFEEKVRRESEEAYKRTMEASRQAQIMAKREIEEARKGAIEAARRSLEEERKQEEERQLVLTEHRKRIEREVRAEFEMELKREAEQKALERAREEEMIMRAREMVLSSMEAGRIKGQEEAAAKERFMAHVRAEIVEEDAEVRRNTQRMRQEVGAYATPESLASYHARPRNPPDNGVALTTPKRTSSPVARSESRQSGAQPKPPPQAPDAPGQDEEASETSERESLVSSLECSSDIAKENWKLSRKQLQMLREEIIMPIIQTLERERHSHPQARRAYPLYPEGYSEASGREQYRTHLSPYTSSASERGSPYLEPESESEMETNRVARATYAKRGKAVRRARRSQVSREDSRLRSSLSEEDRESDGDDLVAWPATSTHPRSEVSGEEDNAPSEIGHGEVRQRSQDRGVREQEGDVESELAESSSSEASTTELTRGDTNPLGSVVTAATTLSGTDSIAPAASSKDEPEPGGVNGEDPVDEAPSGTTTAASPPALATAQPADRDEPNRKRRSVRIESKAEAATTTTTAAAAPAPADMSSRRNPGSSTGRPKPAAARYNRGQVVMEARRQNQDPMLARFELKQPTLLQYPLPFPEWAMFVPAMGVWGDPRLGSLHGMGMGPDVPMGFWPYAAQSPLLPRGRKKIVASREEARRH